MTPTPTGSGGKVLTAFLAGAMFGAFAMVEFAPAGSPTAAGPGQVVLAPGQEAPEFYDEGDPAFDDFDEGGDWDDGFEVADGSGTEPGAAADPGAPADAGQTASGPTAARGTPSGAAPSGGGTTSDAGNGGDSTGTRRPRDGGSGGVAIDGGTGTTGGSGTGTTGGSGPGGDCTAANNGGATDTGISANEIKVAATIVEDGPGASLLQPATIGIDAVLNPVNRAGGICGRRINLTTRNDSWEAQRGRQFLNRFIDDGNFALLVVPSSEGLAEAIQAGDISRAGIPVVGSTGLRRHEYSDPWVFPVATATVSIMRILAKHAYDDGAKSFAIVYDSKYRFGLEGKDAFVQYVNSLRDTTIKSVTALDPDAPDYGSQANRFNNECGNTANEPGCDMVALLLVPETARKWASANSGSAVAGRGARTYGAQTLFTGAFANSCGSWCNRMVVWTGYHPPIAPADRATGVRKYVSDVRAINANVDATNQFVEGAYLGTQVFVDAVAKCSPGVTRQCIQQTLNSGSFTSDLASELAWRPNQRHANRAAQAFRMLASGGSFNGWEYMETGWIRDPGL